MSDSRLVDKKRLAQLAKGLYDKLHKEIGDAVEVEKTRALAAEAKALEDAKKYTDDAIGEVNSSATELAKKVAALETFKSEQLQNNEDQSLRIGVSYK